MSALQDRTNEFFQVLAQVQRLQNARKGVSAQRQSLLTDGERKAAGASSAGSVRKSDFARKAGEIGHGISETMRKLEKLAYLARRRTLFDDRPVEINELTYVIKQDLSALNKDISALQALSKPAARANASAAKTAADQEVEHNRNVAILLQQRLSDVGTHFQGVLEARTKNMAASKSRTENFISAVSSHAQHPLRPHSQGAPPPPDAGRPVHALGLGRPASTSSLAPAPQQDTLSMPPPGALDLQQLQVLEEAGGAGATTSGYLEDRSNAILNIEQTINELGGIFGQLAQMVSEQGNMIERIDANTEDIVDNVQGAQRELLKYWSRVSSNRWLMAKMFGVLMVFFLLWVLVAG